MTRWPRIPATASAVAMACALPLMATQGCLFELGELVSGTGGAGGQGGEATGTGGDGGAAEWWDDDFGQRQRFTLGSVEGSLNDVAIPVFLDSGFDHDAAEPGGADLRFVAADGSTLLAHEIERWDPTGTSLIWVALPNVGPGGDDHFWLYYDNDGAPSGQAPLEVWAGYLGVLHMRDPLSGTSVANAANPDAPANALNLTAANVDEGPLGQAYRFDGGDSAQGVRGGDALEYDVPFGSQATVELWFRRDAAESNVLITQEGCCLGWAVRSLDDGGVVSSWGTVNCCQEGMTGYDNNTFTLPDGTADFGWHHYAIVYDRAAGTVAHYLDGAAHGTGAITSGPDFGAQGQLLVGIDFNQTASFAGAVDEARFRYGAYEQARIALHAASADPGWLTAGAVESR